MNDQLNRHTDPTGIVASLKAANDGRPFLGDLGVVDRLLRQFAAGVFERFDEVGHGILTPNDAASADRAECVKLAAVFCGADPSYAPIRDWTGPQLADHLRARMAHQIQPDEDDASVVAQALAVLVHGLYDILRMSGGEERPKVLQQQAEAAIRSMGFALTGVHGND